MDDIAAAAGVSRTTVSRALSSDGRSVSPATMTAIQRAVQQTGYVINQYARSLATQRSQAVAYVLCEPQQRVVEDPSFNVLLSSCTQELSGHRLTPFLTIAADPDQQAQVHQQVASGQVAGALVVSTCTGGPLIEQLHTTGVPLVVYGAPARGLPVAHVVADDRDGARQLVRYLRGIGRRTIATIAGPRDTLCGAQRLAGWRDSLGAAANDRLVAYADYTCAGGRAAMTQLLERLPQLDAVFVASDLMAAGALAALRRHGRRVPDDVAVGGFGDSAVATTVEPALTTIRLPMAQAGGEMVRLLLEQLGGGPPAAVVLPTDLVIRESA